jgi:hypothetical protein
MHKYLKRFHSAAVIALLEEPDFALSTIKRMTELILSMENIKKRLQRIHLNPLGIQ